jgi:UDPglucose 6-dehydrogenase
MNISIIGTGYVGLVSGSCLASKDVKVRFKDIDHNKIENLRKGIIPIYEPGLDDIVLRNIKQGFCDFTTEIEEAVKNDIIFLAVGTPQDVDGSADLVQVLNVAKDIGHYAEQEDDIIIVVKSTVPPGTCQLVKEEIQTQFKRRGKETKVHVVSNPEFLREGNAIDDFNYPDRIVVGVDTNFSKKVMSEIYKDFDNVLFMDINSSELTKYASNAMLAKKSFSDLSILEAVDNFNEEQKTILVEKLVDSKNGKYYDIMGSKVAIWGLSFKPNTDDMREAASISIINELLEHGAEVKVYDPIASDNAKKILNHKDITFCIDKYEALEDVDALFLVTEWDEFKLENLDFEKIKKKMKTFSIFDGRNLYKKEDILNEGFSYEGIGNNN